ncbi:MAG: GNAT family N-acetyltransferase [Methanolobus sp.]|nr:GNAT family N-acetyltransferase [Methanolobus sp.]
MQMCSQDDTMSVTGTEIHKPLLHPELEIRQMRQNEMIFATGLAGKEGWNPGIHDGECFYRADPEGFFIAGLKGEPVGCISAVSYGQSFGFIGLFIVKPEFRGKGIGTCLWKTATGYLRGRITGLDGVIEQEAYYARHGFLPYYRNLRFEGRGGAAMPGGLTKLSGVLFRQLVEYDSRIFPEPRPHFLDAWIRQEGSFAFAALNGEAIEGYGLVRKCCMGYKIGPLFAENPAVAEKLFLALKSRIPEDEPLFLDVPQPNENAMLLARKYGMQVAFETIRMYAAGKPGGDEKLEKVFGVTTFELG